MKKIQLIIYALVIITSLKAQVTTNPGIPTADAAVIVTFNAAGTPLAGYTGDVYAHTGVSIEGSGRWKYVIGEWGKNATQPKLTKISADLYKLEINPSINEFYKVAAGEKVTEMCFVFRAANPYSGTTYYQTSDIFVTVYQAGLAVSIISPTQQPYFVNASSNFNIHVASTQATSILIKKDGNLVQTQTTSLNSFDYQVTTETSGTHEIIVEASNGTKTVTDNFIYVVRSASTVEALPVGALDGINYIDDNTVRLVLHAPKKNSAYVFGSFNNWQPVAMKRTALDVNNPELRYWATLTNLTAGQEYFFQYLVDDTIKIADPYSEKISDPLNDKYILTATYPNLIPYPEGKTEDIVSVFQTAQIPYIWKTTNFTSPKVDDLVIYELLVRDFTASANYQTMIDTVSYLKKLGINAIELMPINEFEGNDSWGYNPSFYFAPDKAYGTKNKLKEFVDSCHHIGIAVIMDMVLNHSYGQSPLVKLYFNPKAGSYGQTTADNLWYNQTSPNTSYSWGFDFNHESVYTKQFVDSVTSYWLNYYKVDGFRFDFTKGFTNTVGDGWNYDASRIAILERMYDKIKKVNPNAYVILEHLTDNSEEKVLSDYRMLLWGNMNGKYNEATMGYNETAKSDISNTSYLYRGWTRPNLVAYMESHDEERLMYKNEMYGNSSGTYDIKNIKTGLARQEMAACFFFSIPGPKMMWQFGELGYDVSIEYNGRTTKKPIKWEYYNDNDRFRLFQVCSLLIKLKKDIDAFESPIFSINVSGALKRINLNGSTMNITVIGNFGVTSGQIDPNFQQTGTWYDYFSGTSISVADKNALITLAPGEYHIYTTAQLATPTILADIKQINSETKRIGLKVYPNPANTTAHIHFLLDENVKDGEISIFDLTGKKINTLQKGLLAKGEQQFDWNLTDNQGNKVATGLYLLKISSGKLVGSSVIVVK